MKVNKNLFRLVLLLLLPNLCYAEDIGNFFNFASIDASVSGRIIQLIAVITIIALAPSILVMATSFTRIIIVLSFLRNALGLQQSPPNQVLVSLALFLTMFIMAPVLENINNNAIKPLIEEKITEDQALLLIEKPFKRFMVFNTREKDLHLFLSMAGIQEEIKDSDSMPIKAVIPAFIISELRRAFEIGFLIFLPFLIIDILVSSILMAMGIMMMPPVMISLPFKIIFFVLIDGWYLIAGNLVKGFHT